MFLPVKSVRTNKPPPTSEISTKQHFKTEYVSTTRTYHNTYKPDWFQVQGPLQECRLILSGFYGLPYYCTPLVGVPDVIGGLAVWWHSKPNPEPKLPFQTLMLFPYYSHSQHPLCLLPQATNRDGGGTPPLYHGRAAATLFVFSLATTYTMLCQDLTPTQHPYTSQHFTPTSLPTRPLLFIAISVLGINYLSSTCRWASSH